MINNSKFSLSNSINTAKDSCSTGLSNSQKQLLQEADSRLLVQFFKTKYPTEEEQLTFAKQSGFKLDLFDGFMNKNEKYVSARFGLFKLYAREKIGWEIKSKEYAKFLYEYGIAKTWEEIRKKIIEDVAQKGDQRNAIVVIDGDNLSHELSLKELVQQYDTENSHLLHVVVVFANGVVNDAIMSYESLDWISIMHSQTNTKDAADTCITLLLGSLHGSLGAFFPTANHSFIVVTKDHFFEELSQQFKIIGRGCFPAKSIKDTNNILSKLGSGGVIEITMEQKISTSKNTKGVQVTKVVRDPSSDDLKELFQVAWLGVGKSQNQFCKTFGLDSTNFSKYMNEKKYNHSCKLRLEEFYNSFKKSTPEESHFILNIEGNLKEVDIKHHIVGNKVACTIDLEELSFTTPHHYNPLFKEGYPVIYEEWFNSKNEYRAEFLKLIVKEENKIQKNFSCVINGSIVTLPMRMRHPDDHNSFIPIDIEIRQERGETMVQLKAPIGQLNRTLHCYFSFSYWTPQEFVSGSCKFIYSEVTGDIFDGSIRITIRIVTFYLWPVSVPKSNSTQNFFPIHQIDLSQITVLNDLVGKRGKFSKIGDEYILDTREAFQLGSYPLSTIYLKPSVVEYINKRGKSSGVGGIIDSIEYDSKNNLYYVGCKVV